MLLYQKMTPIDLGLLAKGMRYLCEERNGVYSIPLSMILLGCDWLVDRLGRRLKSIPFNVEHS